MQVRTKTRLGIGVLINVPEWSDMSSHSLVFFIRHQQFYWWRREEGMGFFMSVSRESNFFFHASGRSKLFFIHTWGKRYMHTRPKKIIVCLGLAVTLWKRLGKGDQDFLFVFALDILGMQMFQDCLLRKTNKIARIIGTKF